MAGMLYLVPTPIGNLGDISVRCRKTLAEADFIAAEDTRVTLKLLNYLELKKTLVSYYEHNKAESGPRIVARILAGETCVLVSDAGSVGFYGSMASALATGWSDNIAGHNAVMANYSSRYDNTIAYVSPEFAGVTIYAQYAMGDTNENKASNDRYAALGAE